jgi:hypothetical protein
VNMPVATMQNPVSVGLPGSTIFRGRPAIVQDFQYRPGTLEVVLFWNAPQNMAGVDRWRIFQGNESNLILDLGDRNARQATIKMAAAASAMFYVCAVSKFGLEGPKKGIRAIANADSVVLSGTSGATAGTTSVPDHTWLNQTGGGRYIGGSDL